jgi:hypothetical protein
MKQGQLVGSFSNPLGFEEDDCLYDPENHPAMQQNLENPGVSIELNGEKTINELLTYE